MVFLSIYTHCGWSPVLRECVMDIQCCPKYQSQRISFHFKKYNTYICSHFWRLYIMSSPAHFSIVSISSTSRLQQQWQKQARGKTKEDDRRCQAPSRRGSWSREWSYGLRIPLLFESTLFSLMYLSWSLQDFLWFIRFNWYLQFVHQAKDCEMENFLQPIITLWMHLIWAQLLWRALMTGLNWFPHQVLARPTFKNSTSALTTSDLALCYWLREVCPSRYLCLPCLGNELQIIVIIVYFYLDCPFKALSTLQFVLM